MLIAGGKDFSDDELAGLSDAEREALEGDDDEKGALTEIADDDDDEGTDAEAKAAAVAKVKEEAEAKAKSEAEAKEKAAAEAKAKAADEAKVKAEAEAKKKRDAELAAMTEEDRKKAAAEDEAKKTAEKTRLEAEAKVKAEAEAKAKAALAVDDDDFDEPFVPLYTAKPPEKYDEQMAQFDKDDAAAVAEFKDSKIELDELLKRQREIGDKRLALREQKMKAEIASESSEQLASQQWDWECRRFMRNVAKHEGIDYKKDEALFAEFNAQVKVLGADPANVKWSGEKFLQEAHKRVKAFKGLAKATDTDADKKAKEETERKSKEEAERVAKEKAAAARRGKVDLPKTLGGLPSAGSGDLGNEGEFSHLDAMDGMELENAVAKLTPDQQERWART